MNLHLLHSTTTKELGYLEFEKKLKLTKRITSEVDVVPAQKTVNVSHPEVGLVPVVSVTG